MRFGYKNAPYVALILVILLYLPYLSQLPTGYLHTWNQLTTLTWVDTVSASIANWNYQSDYISRIQNQSKDPFRIFEEFPLYALSAGILSKITFNSILASKLTTICALIACVVIFNHYGNFTNNSETSLLCSLILLSSSPFMYYGQAIMSDMAMCCFILFGFMFVEKYMHRNKQIDMYYALIAFSIASLWKSYGIIFIIITLTPFLHSKKRTVTSLLKFGIQICIATLPVILWHGWCLTQEGHHEIYSHSLVNKKDILLSLDFLFLLSNRINSYFGLYAYFSIAILMFYIGIKRSSVCDTILKTQNIKPQNIIYSKQLIYVSICMYLLITLDKLPDHDYYFLPVCILLIPLLSHFLLHVRNRYAIPYFFIIIFVCYLGNSTLGIARFIKASKPNPDVYHCAEDTLTHTKESDKITYWTDVTRYNSIAYVAKRKGIAFEESGIPLRRYTEKGVSFLVINLPVDEKEKIDTYEKKAKDKIIKISEGIYPDFKKRHRVCNIYKISL